MKHASASSLTEALGVASCDQVIWVASVVRHPRASLSETRGAIWRLLGWVPVSSLRFAGEHGNDQVKGRGWACRGFFREVTREHPRPLSVESALAPKPFTSPRVRPRRLRWGGCQFFLPAFSSANISLAALCSGCSLVAFSIKTMASLGRCS
jgi:hypothetical protein